MQVIKDPSFGELFGKQLGTGLGSAIQGLAEQKVKALQKQHFTQNLTQGGYDQNTASILAHLAEQNPQKFPEILAMLGAGSQQQGDEEEMQNAPQNFAQSIAKGTKKGDKELDPKYFDILSSQKDNLTDMISTTDNMLKSLNKGIKVGILPGYLSHIAPTLIDKNSELFDKDAAHIINLQSAQIKGVPSRFRVQLIEKEKPGLRHSIPVNKQILTRLNREAKEKLKDLSRRYPQLSDEQEMQRFQQPQQQNIFNELPDPAQFNGKRIRDKKTGQILMSNGVQWIPAE